MSTEFRGAQNRQNRRLVLSAMYALRSGKMTRMYSRWTSGKIGRQLAISQPRYGIQPAAAPSQSLMMARKSPPSLNRDGLCVGDFPDTSVRLSLKFGPRSQDAEFTVDIGIQSTNVLADARAAVATVSHNLVQCEINLRSMVTRNGMARLWRIEHTPECPACVGFRSRTCTT